MSILTKIDSIPVFTKKSEALAWARLNGFIGCDKYTYLGQMGYMPAKARAGSAYSKIYTKTITVDVNYIDKMFKMILGEMILEEGKVVKVKQEVDIKN